MTALGFTVPGQPRPKGSWRIVRGKLVADSSAAVTWQRAVAVAAVDAMRAAGHEPAGSRVPVALGLHFVMPKPKAHPRTREVPAAVKPDIDKLARCVLDALAGVVYGGDQQVTELRARKTYGDGPGVHVSAEWPAPTK